MSRIKHPNIIKLYATTSMKDMLDTRFYIVLGVANHFFAMMLFFPNPLS